ncbi:MAG: hypothetical protein ACT4PV_16635 [Planctomycetaceae bacterium]
MGGFLVWQAAHGVRGRAPAFEQAKAWLAAHKGLAFGEERAGRALKLRRVNGTGAPLCSSPRGWLVTAGCWRHPDAGEQADALLGRLETEGASALDTLEGNYALCWWDEASGTLLVELDPLGRLHLFVRETDEGTLLSTSSTAIAAAGGSEPDAIGVAEFLACGTFYEDRTPFARVRRLRGGFRYRFRAGRPPQLEARAPAMGGETAAPGRGATPEQVRDTLTRLVGSFLGENARPLCDLTGGYDSRLVLGLLLAAGVRPEVTVSGPPTSGDVRVARNLAAALGLAFHHVPASGATEAQADFATVLRAARRAEGCYDAVEYAGIAHVHERHCALPFDASVNGSGGEVFRNYWWDAGDLARPGTDALALGVPRFARLALETPWLEPGAWPGPGPHFRGVVERSLARLPGRPIDESLDHLYLDLRMQCWQGAIASATNQFWPTVSPLLLRAALAAVAAVGPRPRLRASFLKAMMAGFLPVLRNHPLESGFPPLALRPSTLWRHVPGLLKTPGRFWERLRQRALRGRAGSAASAQIVRRLFASGAADYLQPATMALRPLVRKKELEEFLGTARESGRVAAATLGRLLALESALRGAHHAPN